MAMFRKKLNPLLAKKNNINKRISATDKEILKLVPLRTFVGETGRLNASARERLVSELGEEKVRQIEKYFRQENHYQALRRKIDKTQARRAEVLGPIRLVRALGSAIKSKRPLRNMSRIDKLTE